MTKKANLSWRIGMIMLVLCATLIVAVLPAAADYTADKPLVTYEQGTITGDVNYTIGNSSYSSKMWSNDTSNLYVVALPQAIPTNLDRDDVVVARLYVYPTWSYNYSSSSGVLPEMNVNFDGTSFNSPEKDYNDSKGSESYDYPSATYCYDVTGLIDPSSSSDHIVTVHNSHDEDDFWTFNIQAVGLYVAYNDSSTSSGIAPRPKYYWIDEGCDVTYTRWKNTTNSWDYGITPDDAVSMANFTNVDSSSVNSAKLITCVPSGGTPYNRLYVNNFCNYWTGLWNANPYADFSWTETEIKDNLKCGINYVGFQNGLYTMIPYPYAQQERQMQAANAFLLITNE
jgi:hypothetical protein